MSSATSCMSACFLYFTDQNGLLGSMAQCLVKYVPRRPTEELRSVCIYVCAYLLAGLLNYLFKTFQLPFFLTELKVPYNTGKIHTKN